MISSLIWFNLHLAHVLAELLVARTVGRIASGSEKMTYRKLYSLVLQSSKMSPSLMECIFLHFSTATYFNFKSTTA